MPDVPTTTTEKPTEPPVDPPVAESDRQNCIPDKTPTEEECDTRGLILIVYMYINNY